MVTRRAPITKRNPKLSSLPAKRGERNKGWLARSGIDHGVILLGASTLAGFRVRVAQSISRADLRPSFWSHVGILRGGRIDTVAFDARGGVSSVPQSNGVGSHGLSEFDDPGIFPNVAVMQFTEEQSRIRKWTKHVGVDRQTVDLPTLLVTWLAYIWGAREQRNPLVEGYGVPSAAMVSTVYALAGIELTPGLTTRASTPEAIWQAAVWWHRFYGEAKKDSPSAEAGVQTPSGKYVIRQEAASVAE